MLTLVNPEKRVPTDHLIRLIRSLAEVALKVGWPSIPLDVTLIEAWASLKSHRQRGTRLGVFIGRLDLARRNFRLNKDCRRAAAHALSRPPAGADVCLPGCRRRRPAY
jgi:hypothetical protein